MLKHFDDIVPFDDLSEAQYERFIENRGGCTCFLSPPCPACCDPYTPDDLDDVGFHEFAESKYREPDPVDFSHITRSLCK